MTIGIDELYKLQIEHALECKEAIVSIYQEVNNRGNDGKNINSKNIGEIIDIQTGEKLRKHCKNNWKTEETNNGYHQSIEIYAKSKGMFPCNIYSEGGRILPEYISQCWRHERKIYYKSK